MLQDINCIDDLLQCQHGFQGLIVVMMAVSVCSSRSVHNFSLCQVLSSDQINDHVDETIEVHILISSPHHECM